LNFQKIIKVQKVYFLNTSLNSVPKGNLVKLRLYKKLYVP
jgi:hypothetical protein